MSTTTMRRTALGTIGLAVTATLTLSGCKSGNEEAPPAAPSSPAASAAQPGAAGSPDATASPSAAGSEAPAGAAGTAKPGQSFKIGQTATVPFTYGSTKGTIALTVTSIEEGRPADLDPLKLGDKVKGMVPYYIHYTVKNVGTTDLAYSSVGHIKGLLPDGGEANGVSVIGTFEKCKDDALPKGFTNGQSQTSCAIAMAPSAQVKITGAEYWGEPYSTVGNKALTWK
ncbi:hypothetical protein ACIGQE_32495 [Streptomyces sp. NPDC053429]|uniref:hypothetical protein n=1 Tax=Streptomyces sp. NPDC053429 TaxID=3365702 RepID=UPI0037D235A0